MQTALVTGCAGFIGSNLCKRLINDGIQVVGVDDLSAGKAKNIEGLDLFWYEADITDYDAIDRIIDKHRPDVIFNQAASKKNICEKNPYRDLEVNGAGTLNLLQIASLNGVKSFVHASTGSVYGEVAGEITEQTPYNPVSYYGVSKMAGESYAKMFSKLMNVSILRYFHVYGPNQDSGPLGGVVAIFINKLLKNEHPVIFGDGNQVRSFTYVDDVVEANIMATENPGIYNVASGTRTTIKNLLREIQSVSDLYQQPEYADWQPGDIKNFNVNNEKATNELGIKWTQFRKGLLITIMDYAYENNNAISG